MSSFTKLVFAVAVIVILAFSVTLLTGRISTSSPDNDVSVACPQDLQSICKNPTNNSYGLPIHFHTQSHDRQTLELFDYYSWSNLWLDVLIWMAPLATVFYLAWALTKPTKRKQGTAS